MLRSTMVVEKPPKIVLNDDFVDLREDYTSNDEYVRSGPENRVNSGCNKSKPTNVKNELRFEKELINCGLKKLANKYNATKARYQKASSPDRRRRKVQRESSMVDPGPESSNRLFNPCRVYGEVNLKSQSEISIKPKRNMKNCGTSVPVFRKSSMDISNEQQKQEKIKNRFTLPGSNKRETVKQKSERSRSLTRKSQKVDAQLDMPQKYALMKQVTNHADDSTICKNNSGLNLHWKRSWTLPLFTPKSVAVDRNMLDTLDRQTYVYDDGTEVDSMAMNLKPNTRLNKGTQRQCMPLMFFGGTLCAILLVSLLIWIIFGQHLLDLVFQPRVVKDGTLKRYTKYIGGGIIYVITSLFRTIGRLLVIPAQNVHQNQQDYKWPVNPAYFERN